jgi:hypothetical protein
VVFLDHGIYSRDYPFRKMSTRRLWALAFEHTVAHLYLMNIDGIDAMSVLPGDLPMGEDLLKGALSGQGIAERVRSMQASLGDRILAYVVPVNYIMQGMIADTGPEWRLFQRHQTFAMISDYILNPVGHLQGGHMGHAGTMMHNSPEMQRRIIFVEVGGKRPLGNSASDFGINDKRPCESRTRRRARAGAMYLHRCSEGRARPRREGERG